nr:hypothetical protein [Tanacetum cinerariifolium]
MLNKDEPLLIIHGIHGVTPFYLAIVYGRHGNCYYFALRQLSMANILAEDRFFAFQELQEIRAILTTPIGKECRFPSGDIFIINPKGGCFEGDREQLCRIEGVPGTDKRGNVVAAAANALITMLNT